MTETGTWGGTFDAAGELVSPISFAIPIPLALSNLKVKKVAIGGSLTQCDNETGEAASAENPEADPGFLCVFVGLDQNVTPVGVPDEVVKAGAGTGGASTSGAIIRKIVGEAGKLYFGTYAVTAP